MKTLKNFLRNYIDDEKELNDFSLWAFGIGVDEMDHNLWFMDEWNKRHYHEYALSVTSYIKMDPKIMIDLWKQSLKGDSECS